MAQLHDALARAETFVQAMPSDSVGVLILQNGIPVQPDPASLASYTAQPGCRRGHWPCSPEIASAMLHTSAGQSQSL